MKPTVVYTWVPPWYCEPIASWFYHSWSIAEYATPQTYDLEQGIRILGFEFIRHSTKEGSVL